MTGGTPTRYDPSPDDPRIVAVLAAESRLLAAMLAGDIATIEGLIAPDLIVHAPINRVVDRENVMARYRAGQISYEPDLVRVIDFAGVRAGAIVLMGEEIVHPIKDSPHAGKTVRRRFTDIWWNVADGWRLGVRHATISSID